VIRMGRDEMLSFLKKNEGDNFSVRELSGLFDLNYKSAFTVLKKLKDVRGIHYKEVRKGSNMVGLYSFENLDEFDTIFVSVDKLKKRFPDFQHRTDYCLLLLILKELKKSKGVKSE